MANRPRLTARVALAEPVAARSAPGVAAASACLRRLPVLLLACVLRYPPTQPTEPPVITLLATSTDVLAPAPRPESRQVPMAGTRRRRRQLSRCSSAAARSRQSRRGGRRTTWQGMEHPAMPCHRRSMMPGRLARAAGFVHGHAQGNSLVIVGRMLCFPLIISFFNSPNEGSP